MKLRFPCWLALGLAVAVQTADARPFDDVIESGVITIFVYSDYAPYSWGEGEAAQGIDVEIARHIGDSLGVKTELLIRGADENLDDDLRVNIWKGDLINRRVADVMLHVPVDREVDIRNELAVITAPYFQEQMAVVIDSDELPEVDTFGWFVSNAIAVELDTAGDFFLSNAFQGRLHPSIRRGRTFEDAVSLFLEGEVPALMASRAQTEWVARLAAERDITADVIQPPMPGIVRTGWPIGIAIKHDSRDLGYAVGDVLTQMIDSGQMAELYASYGVEWMPPVME
jgi:ABC-type amino acid transport substrate-binding protein